MASKHQASNAETPLFLYLAFQVNAHSAHIVPCCDARIVIWMELMNGYSLLLFEGYWDNVKRVCLVAACLGHRRIFVTLWLMAFFLWASRSKQPCWALWSWTRDICSHISTNLGVFWATFGTLEYKYRVGLPRLQKKRTLGLACRWWTLAICECQGIVYEPLKHTFAHQLDCLQVFQPDLTVILQQTKATRTHEAGTSSETTRLTFFFVPCFLVAFWLSSFSIEGGALSSGFSARRDLLTRAA